jgi:hypothetical protein
MRNDRTKTTDQLLVDELARLAPPFGGWAVKFAAKSLPTEKQSESLLLKMSAETVYEHACLVLKALGRLIEGNRVLEDQL